MRSIYNYALLLFLTLFLSACGSQHAANVSGNWNGEFVAAGGSAPFSMSLVQDGSSVSGTFAFIASPAFFISGTAADNLVSVGAQDESGGIQIHGSVSGDTMTGTMTLRIGDRAGVGDFTATK